VCPKPGHTPATHTIFMFQVDDIAAWFKDPAVNILEVLQER